MDTAQKMKFPIKDFFSKWDQIRRKLRIWSYLPKKSFIFCAVGALTCNGLIKIFHNKMLPQGKSRPQQQCWKQPDLKGGIEMQPMKTNWHKIPSNLKLQIFLHGSFYKILMILEILENYFSQGFKLCWCFTRRFPV